MNRVTTNKLNIRNKDKKEMSYEDKEAKKVQSHKIQSPGFKGNYDTESFCILLGTQYHHPQNHKHKRPREATWRCHQDDEKPYLPGGNHQGEDQNHL